MPKLWNFKCRQLWKIVYRLHLVSAQNLIGVWGAFFNKEGISKELALNYLENSTLEKHPGALYWTARHFEDIGEKDRAQNFYVLAATCGVPAAIKKMEEILKVKLQIKPCYKEPSQIGGCFISTAVCIYMNKPDNCDELMILRKYRDTWLMAQPGGKALIDEYYHIAPSIVASIETRHDKGEIYSNLLEEYILPCVEEIKMENYEQAKDKYMEMVMKMKEQYLSDNNTLNSFETGTHEFIVAIDNKDISDMNTVVNEYTNFGYNMVQAFDYEGNRIIILGKKKAHSK